MMANAKLLIESDRTISGALSHRSYSSVRYHTVTHHLLTLRKFVTENYTENFATLKITLKNNIKEGFTENYTEKRPLPGMQKTVNLSHFYPN